MATNTRWMWRRPIVVGPRNGLTTSRRAQAACSVALLLSLTACQPPQAASTSAPATPERETTTVDQSAATTPTPPATPANHAEVTVQAATWDEVQAAVRAHAGKVVVVDLWSNYCPPCMKELPGLVRLSQSGGDEVVCMTLNCNFNGTGDVGEENEKVLAFLREINARLMNFISRDVDQDLYQRIGVASIPVVQVYGRDGKLAKQFDNDADAYGPQGFHYEEHVIPYVMELLKR